MVAAVRKHIAQTTFQVSYCDLIRNMNVICTTYTLL